MRIAVTRVLRLAERQWGVIARWQLEQCGLSAAAISRWVASGRLQRIYPGVYAAGHRAIPVEGRLLAAILYAGPGAALSHSSAAHWWGFLPYLPETTHTTGPRRRRSIEEVRVHRAQRIERVMRRGVPVTPSRAPSSISRRSLRSTEFARPSPRRTSSISSTSTRSMP